MYINFKSQNICEIKTSTINMIWRTEGEQFIISSHSIPIMALNQGGGWLGCFIELTV